MAVKLDLGGVVFTDDEMRAKREIGAFVYVSDPLSGAPRRPAWGMRDGKSKVYATVAECLTDNDRGWSGTGPEDKLTSAPNIANDGVHFELKGTIGTFEGSADIALVNVSDVTEKIVLKKSAHGRAAASTSSSTSRTS